MNKILLILSLFINKQKNIFYKFYGSWNVIEINSQTNENISNNNNII